MLSKETFFAEREAGELSMATVYEYYLENRNEGKPLLDEGAFSLAFMDFLKFPMTSGSDGRVKMINETIIFRRIINYFNEKFNI